MPSTRQWIGCAAGVVALGGTYYAGTQARGPAPAADPPAVRGEPTAAKVPAPEIVDGLVIPTVAIAPPDANLVVDRPTDVLTGVVPLPPDLFKAPPPPARPDLIVPTLPPAGK